MFPSNIQGLPTWFTIRASKHGYIGRKKEIDFLVAMNPETAREDVMNLDSGAAVVYDEPLKLDAIRQTRRAGLSRGKVAQTCAQYDL